MDKVQKKLVPGELSDLFAQIPAELKTRLDNARGKGKEGAISQNEAVASLIEFALPYIESIAPGKFNFKTNGEVKAKK